MAGLTACGGSGGSDKSSDGGDAAASGSVGAATSALKKAAESTGEQKSAKVEGSQTQAMPQGKMVTETEGSIDWSDGGTTAEMEITQKGGAAKAAPGGGKPMPVRYTADAMYINQGDAAAGLGGSKSKPWMKIDYAKLAKQGGASGALVKDQVQNNNPTRSVELLLAGGDVKKIGSEKVNGEQTDHYSGTVKISDMTRMQSKNLSKKELDELAKQMEKQGLKTQTVDLWINEDDLLVKKQEKAKSKAGEMESTVTYSDYGTKVSVEAPPASETMDFEEAMGAASKG